ncbi:MAG: flavin reductase family protein [Gemmataceae bacterium]|nr:flavin reductase family protein [Gemmataceae bacterium]
MTFDPVAVSTVFAQTDREVWLLAATDGERRGGLIATSVASASIVSDLPRIVLSLGKQHHTWKLVESSLKFVLHLLRDDQLELAWQFATTTGHHGDKFAELAFEAGPCGPRLTDAAGWLDGVVETSLDLGDRTLYVVEIVEGQWIGPGPALTVQRMIRTAAPDQLRLVKSQMAEHGAADAEAIRRWRSRAESPRGDSLPPSASGRGLG